MNDAELDRLRTLRGRYIDRAIDIESRIDTLIGQFFRVDGRHSQEFQWWVLNEMQLGSKIKAVRSIADQLSTDTDTGELVKALETMRDRRNVFAHRRFQGTVVIDEDGRQEGGVVQHARRPRTRAAQIEPVNLDNFDQYLADLDDVIVPLTSLLAAAFQQWPFISETDGVVTHHRGTLSDPDDSAPRRGDALGTDRSGDPR